MVIITTTEHATAGQLQPLALAARDAGGVAVVSIMHATAPASRHKSKIAVRAAASRNVSGRAVPHVPRGLRLMFSGAPQEARVLFGRDTIGMTLCNIHFDAAYNAFLQPNTAQAEVLHRLVAEAAGESNLSSAVCAVLQCFLVVHNRGTRALTLTYHWRIS